MAQRKCIGPCGKLKPLDDYNQDQAKCKDCTASIRSFWRQAKKEGVEETWLKAPGADRNAVLKEFTKERSQALQIQARVKLIFQLLRAPSSQNKGTEKII